MPHYILDKMYKITDSGGLTAHRVVVQGTNAGECEAPGAENAGAILGVTVHAQSLQNQNVSVRKAGIARVVASSPVEVGAPVNVGSADGKVQDCRTVVRRGEPINCLGFAETAAEAEGDVFEVFISMHQRAAPR